MAIKNIKCTKVEIEDKINVCCKELNINCKKFYDKEKLIQFLLIRNNQEGKLRVFQTKKGINIDDSIFADKELYYEFENCIRDSLEKVENRKFSFKNISEEHFSNIYTELNKLDENITLQNREIKDPNKSHFFEVKNNKTKEIVRISKYKNGTLLLDGIDWLLWTDICSIIDQEINSTPLDIFDRFLEVKEIEVKEIDKVFRTNNYTNEEENLKERLSEDVFLFLDEHFRNYLISSQRLIDCDIELPEYSPILCPLAKVLEGYLKRLFVHLKIETYEAIEGKWNFGHVFKGEECIIPKKKVNITDKQENQLLIIYTHINNFRNNQNHGSLNPTKVYIDKEASINKYNEILEVIKTTYYNIV